MIASLDQCQIIWKSALEVLENEITDKYVFQTFFENNTHLYQLDGSEAIIAVKGKMSKIVLESKFLTNIQNALHNVTETIFRCTIKEHSELYSEHPATEIKSVSALNIFATNLNPTLSFANFVIGDCNREAHTASLTVATEPGKFFNPLFIYGKSGTGKTHLLNAIGNYIRANFPQNLKVLFVETRDFIDDYIKAAKNKNFDDLTRKYETIDILLIDDIQFLVGSAGTSEFFFNVFNKLINSRKQIVLTSDRRPLDLRGLEERLVSRFSQGLSVNIDAPQYDTAISILRKKIEIHRLSTEDINEEVLDYIASKFSSDVRQLEGALNRLIFFSISNKKNQVIDLNTAMQALDPIGTTNTSGKITIGSIIDVVCEYYGLTREQMESRVRTNRLANARHIAMYLCRELIKDSSFLKIAKEFGGRDHTTVMNGCEKIEKLIKVDSDYRLVIKTLKQSIEK